MARNWRLTRSTAVSQLQRVGANAEALLAVRPIIHAPILLIPARNVAVHSPSWSHGYCIRAIADCDPIAARGFSKKQRIARGFDLITLACVRVVH
jgi:hypothetical protein